MTRLRKSWKTALVITVLLITAQVAVSLLARTHRVHNYLTARLERAFGRPIEVDHFNVQILPTPSVHAKGLTVGEDPAFGYEYFLRAEYLTAGLRWADLVRGHFEFGTLSMSRPSLILVRNNGGRWNLAEWLPPAKKGPMDHTRVYGPATLAAAPNRLEKIEFSEGRINFKNGDVKQPFAFTDVTGTVEQVALGRWQLSFQAQPWRSAVSLQSTGRITVRGDVAGTSARLQPAAIHVIWERVSLADFFRLLRGEDYGVRGIFALEATAKSGVSAENAPVDAVGDLPLSTSHGRPAPEQANYADWTVAVQARAAGIHRWDLAERADNPSVNASLTGRWNIAAGTLNVEQVLVQAPRSNLRGTANLSSEIEPSVKLRVQSAGVQASDLLAWYRAFHSDVAEGITFDQFITGEVTAQGWPLVLQDVAFSSPGGTVKIPGLNKTLHIGSLRGTQKKGKIVVDPVQAFLSDENREGIPERTRSAPLQEHTASKPAAGADIALTYDTESRAGDIIIAGRAENVQEGFNVASAFGRSLNHGWELSGGARAELRWKWSRQSPGMWDGNVDLTSGQLQAAGLNLPVAVDDVRLEWQEGKRTVHIRSVHGFGAVWSGEIAEPIAPEDPAGEKWKFQLHADRLDATELDRWIGPRARPGWLQRLLPSLLGTTSPGFPASELMRRLNAEGELRVDELTIEKLKLEQLRAKGSVQDLQLDVVLAEAQWAGGALRARMSAKFLPRPKYNVTAELARVNLMQLPLAAPTSERFGGVASGKIHLETEGVGRGELLQKLTGNGELQLKDIDFRGWDVDASIAAGAPRSGVSHWLAGTGTFTVSDRRVAVEELRLDGGKDLTLVYGTVSFARDADLAIETMIAGKRLSRPAEAGHVLKIVGPLDDPRVMQQSLSVRQPAD